MHGRRWWWWTGAAAVFVAGALVAVSDRSGDDDAIKGDERCGPEQDLIVTTTGDNGDASIEVVGPGGALSRKISTDTSGVSASTRPAASPDGTRIAYTFAPAGDYESAGPGLTELWTMGPDGSDPTRLTAGPRDDEAAWSPDGTTIAFSDQEAGSIALIDPDGTGRRALPGTKDGDALPAWSPDATQLAFVRRDVDTSEVWVTGMDGSGRRKLGDLDVDAWVSWLTWTPDGTRLLAGGSWTGTWSIDLDGTVQRLAGRATMPSFSADGHRFTFVHRPSNDDPWQLWEGELLADRIQRTRPIPAAAIGFLYPYFGVAVITCQQPPEAPDPPDDDCAGLALIASRWRGELAEAPTPIAIDPTTGTERAVVPSWNSASAAGSPAGEELAVERAVGEYESSGPESTTIWTVGLDGTDPDQISEGPFDSMPAWSPDGSTIAYETRPVVGRAGTRLLASTRSASGTRTRVLDEPPEGFHDRSPAWSPDGRLVAFVRDRDMAPASTELWVVRSDGTDARQVASLPLGYGGWPVWTPDGESVLVAGGAVQRVEVATGEVREIARYVDALTWTPEGALYGLLTSSGTPRLVRLRLGTDRLLLDEVIDLSADGPPVDRGVVGLAAGSLAGPLTAAGCGP
jgi:Tol biopolymer transport system component